MFSPPKRSQFPRGFLPAMGYIVALWSSLETATRHCLYTWLPHKDQDFHLILAQMDMKARLASLKAIAFERLAPSDFDICEAWINSINTDLRNYRNRLVHDQWSPPSDLSAKPHTFRVNTNAKITRSPGSGSKQLLRQSATPVSVRELELFASDIVDAWVFVSHLPMYSKEQGFALGVPSLALRHKQPPASQKANPNKGQTTRKSASQPPTSQE